MKKYFLCFILFLLSVGANAQTENQQHIIAHRDSFPSKQEMMKRARSNYGPWMLSIGGGGARWIAILPDSLDPPTKKFFNSLLWGYTLKGSAAYFLKFGLGFGFQYHGYFSSAKLDSTDYPSLRTSSFTEKISMQYFSVGAQYRHINKSGSGYLNFGVAVGYFRYHDVGQLEAGNKVVEKIEATGGVAGLQLQASYNYRIDPRVSLGIGIGINNGILNGVTVREGGRTYRDTSVAGSLIHFDLHAKLTIIL